MSLLCLFLGLTLATVGGWFMRDPRQPGRHSAEHFARLAAAERVLEPTQIIPALEVATP